MKTFLILKNLLRGLFLTLAISCPNIIAASSAQSSKDYAEEETATDLSERERLAKSLIETVQKLLENGDTQTREEIIRQLNGQTAKKEKKSRSNRNTEKPKAPESNPAPNSERSRPHNGNPRPYLGEPSLNNPMEILVPEISYSESETSEIQNPETSDPYIEEYYEDEDDTEYDGHAEEEGTINLFPFLNPVENPDSEGMSGNYIWVPDSIYGQVVDLIEGRFPAGGKYKTPMSQIDPTMERVIFRGDTIPMVIRDRKIGRYDRNLYNYLSYPRGIWGASLTASYGELSTDQLEMLSLLSDVTLKGHIFSIKPAISYFIKNNLAIGLRLSYTEGKAGIDSFKVEIEDDMNFNLSDIGYHSEQYQAGIFITRYYGLSRRNKIQLTNEVELGFSSGNSDFRRPYGGVSKETHTTTMKASLTFSPGVSVQIMRNVSFDLSFGAFGLYIERDKTMVDGVYQGSRTASGANFRFNIFNINFGIGVHI